MLKYLALSVVIVGGLLGLTAWLTGNGVHTLDQAVYAADPKAPEFAGTAADWINTDGKPLKLYGGQGILADDPYAPGKKPVVLVDFWEYTCVNCIRTLPYVKEWAARYKSSGLIVVGVHTPEFKFAHNAANVAAAVKRFGITYPVLVDSDYANWNDYDNQFWPMKYVIDHNGKIVFTHPGEGGYAETEQRLRDLLLAANPGETLPDAYGDHTARVKSLAPVYDMTGELYAGPDKSRLQNPERFGGDKGQNYAAIDPSQWIDGELVLRGQWRFGDEYVEPVTADPAAMVGVKYHARDAVAVIKPQSATPFKVYVTQDGAPVERADAGSDLHYDPDGRSYLLIDAPREYQITHNRLFGTHTLSLTPGTTAFRLYSFDFAAT